MGSAATEHRSVVPERLQGMTIYQLLTADWRIRLLARLTCAPRPLPRPTMSRATDGDPA